MLAESLQQLGFPMENVHWLAHSKAREFDRHSYRLAKEISINFHLYEDSRPSRQYLTSIRPWLISKFLAQNEKSIQESTLYIDADLWVNNLDFKNGQDLGDAAPYLLGSDVSEYGRLELLPSDVLELLSKRFTKKAVQEHLEVIPGVQWVFRNLSPAFFTDLYWACEDTFKVLANRKSTHGDVDPWMADIYATPLLAATLGMRHGVSRSLSYSLMDNPVDDFESRTFYHNSGAGGREAHRRGIFDKREWINESPLGASHVLSPKYASYMYVQRMKLVDPRTRVLDFLP